MSPTLSAAMKRGLEFLAAEQQADGSFISYSSPSAQPFEQKLSHLTVFTPAIALAALSSVTDAAARKIRDKLSHWLLDQKGANGAFNYWAQAVPERSHTPYPDDLDDTFAALIAMQLHDESQVTGGMLAQAIKLLLATETATGGPYRTWLVPKDSSEAWLDVDLAVNCNIAFFLSLVSNPLPKLTALMEQAITQGKFHSPYYPSEYPILYYLARAYDGPKRATLLRHILKLQQADGSWSTPMQTALMVSVLGKLGRKTGLETAGAYLISTQNEAGYWEAEAFCLDPALEGKQYYSGARALTTALVLEALQQLKPVPRQKKLRQATTISVRQRNIERAVVAAARQRFSRLGAETADAAEALLARFGGEDSDVVSLPYAFYHSLTRRPVLDDQLFIDLGLANLYGWIAYTVFDDFLDDEGDPRLLSMATAALRYSLHHFDAAVPHHQTFRTRVDETFNTIDSANAWEVSHARFTIKNGRLRLGELPDYAELAQLADRSLGHALTPLAVLAASGELLDSAPALACFRALRHYLIARQLGDDLHDWESDVAKGHITFVVSEILKDLGPPTKTQPLQQLLGVMRQQFWHVTLPRLCRDISRHTTTARQALAPEPLLKPANVITDLLDGIDATNAETIAMIDRAEEFLSNYREEA